MKCANLRVKGNPRGEEREKGIKNTFESFPNLKWETVFKRPEAQRVPNNKNPNRPTPGHIMTMEDVGSVPGLGRSPGGGHSNPLQYSCLENPQGQRSLVG